MLDILDKGVCDSTMVKKVLSHYIDKEITLKYNLGRNKYEVYKAKITNLYNSVFLVEINDENKMTKSFSYADIITKTIKIFDK